jgi:hypothetical protein
MRTLDPLIDSMVPSSSTMPVNMKLLLGLDAGMKRGIENAGEVN